MAHKNAVAQSDLLLFAEKPQQVQIEQDYWEPVRCINLNGTDIRSPLEFNIQGLDDYLTSPNFMLRLEVEVKTATGAALDPLKPVAPVCGFLMSLFSSAEVTVGSTTIPFSQGAFPYVSYLKNLLNYSSTAQQSILRKSLYARDIEDEFDDVSATDNGNDGFTYRQEWIMSNAIELVGPLNLDIASSNRLLLNKLNVNVKLQRTTAPWVLMTDEADNTVVYQVNINQAELLCKRVKIRCADLRRIEATLNRHPARYDFLSSSFFAITFPPKITQLDTSILQRKMPRRVVVVMTSQDAYNGSYKANPYNFQSMSVRNIQLDFNGNLYPRTPQDWKWTAPFSFGQPYLSLIQNYTSDGIERSDINITPDDFKGGYGIFSFALSPDMDPENRYGSAPQHGVLGLKIQFRTEQAKPFMILCFLETEREMLVDRDLNVRVE